MIVDTSALIAILRNEPDAGALEETILHSDGVAISAANYLEAAIVVDAQSNPILSRRLDEYLQLAGIQIAEVTPRQAAIARYAYRDFGKGSGHPARLNFGDCLAYALAKDRDETLLFVGRDFTHTDVLTPK